MYWENNEERDVEGYEMRMPDGMLIPQLKGDESDKYLGTELRTGWANGEGPPLRLSARSRPPFACS